MQFPAEAHDTTLTWASPPAFSLPKPGISIARPHTAPPARACAVCVTAGGAAHPAAATQARAITIRYQLTAHLQQYDPAKETSAFRQHKMPAIPRLRPSTATSAARRPS